MWCDDRKVRRESEDVSQRPCFKKVEGDVCVRLEQRRERNQALHSDFKRTHKCSSETKSGTSPRTCSTASCPSQFSAGLGVRPSAHRCIKGSIACMHKMFASAAASMISSSNIWGEKPSSSGTSVVGKAAWLGGGPDMLVLLVIREV